MKPNSTDADKARQKRDAVKSVVTSSVIRLITVGILLYTRAGAPWPWFHDLLLCICTITLATIPFSFVVLSQRFKEIDKGELEDAKKY